MSHSLEMIGKQEPDQIEDGGHVNREDQVADKSGYNMSHFPERIGKQEQNQIEEAGHVHPEDQVADNILAQHAHEAPYTDEEEKRVVRKIDLMLLPLVRSE